MGFTIQWAFSGYISGPDACRLSASEAYASAKASAYNVSEGGSRLTPHASHIAYNT